MKTIETIQVLGSGCRNCHNLLKTTQEAAARLDLAVEVEYITDMEKILASGVMRMPALMINAQVASSGKVLKANEVETLLKGWLV